MQNIVILPEEILCASVNGSFIYSFIFLGWVFHCFNYVKSMCQQYFVICLSKFKECTKITLYGTVKVQNVQEKKNKLLNYYVNDVFVIYIRDNGSQHASQQHFLIKWDFNQKIYNLFFDQFQKEVLNMVLVPLVLDHSSFASFFLSQVWFLVPQEGSGSGFDSPVPCPFQFQFPCSSDPLCRALGKGE